jgi:hypothetical protein
VEKNLKHILHRPENSVAWHVFGNFNQLSRRIIYVLDVGSNLTHISVMTNELNNKNTIVLLRAIPKRGLFKKLVNIVKNHLM